MGRNSLALDRMTDKQLWSRAALDAVMVRDLFLGPEPHRESIRLGRELQAILVELRLRGTQLTLLEGGQGGGGGRSV
jgi:hypothetical protein